MGLVTNGYRNGLYPFQSRGGALGSIYNAGGALFTNGNRPGRMRAGFFTQYAAYPIGNLGPHCWMLPQKGGAMSMRTGGSGSMTANLIPSYPMSIDMTGFGDLEATAALAIAMAIAMTGSGSLTAGIEGRLNMSVDMTGAGDLSADLEGIANMAIDLLGSGDLEATIAAYGNMEIDITVTGTGLSTANVGDAVWNYLFTELSSIPGANPAAKEAVMLLYQALRNKRATTATTDDINNNAGTPIGSATLSDDGTTFEKGKYS